MCRAALDTVSAAPLKLLAAVVGRLVLAVKRA
jgi:hypothetical protein